MGLGVNGTRFLCYLKKNEQIDLTEVLMLGRQELMMKKAELSALESDYKDILRKKLHSEKYAENFLLALGAGRVSSMDVSDYEGVTYIHDMNQAVPEALENRFTCIIDGGTTEHIFNYSMAVKNIMRMLARGGVYIGMVPMNHWSGHGLYQFSPSLFIQLFSAWNGFRLEHLCLDIKYQRKKLFEITDKRLKKRIEINGTYPALLFIMAVKEQDTPQDIVFQEEVYEYIWHPAVKSGRKAGNLIITKIDRMPVIVQKCIDRLRQRRNFKRLKIIKI